MAGDPFRHVQAGTRLPGMPAPLMNALIDEVRGGEQHSGAPPRPVFAQSGIVKVRNDSGADRGRWGVLQLDVPIITPTVNEAEFQRQVAFAGITPTSSTAKVVILQEPLRAGAIGKAVLAGVTVARVTGAAAEYAAPITGNMARLQCSGTGAARVLWAEAGSAERWAVVRMADKAKWRTKVYRTSAQSIPPGSTPQQCATVMTWEAMQGDGGWSLASPTHVYLPAPGVYVCTANLQVTRDFYEGPGLGDKGAGALQITFNGAGSLTGHASAPLYRYGSSLAKCNASITVEAVAADFVSGVPSVNVLGWGFFETPVVTLGDYFFRVVGSDCWLTVAAL